MRHRPVRGVERAHRRGRRLEHDQPAGPGLVGDLDAVLGAGRCPGTVQDRSSVPCRLHSKTRDGVPGLGVDVGAGVDTLVAVHEDVRREARAPAPSRRPWSRTSRRRGRQPGRRGATRRRARASDRRSSESPHSRSSTSMRGALAGADGAVHVAGPVRRGLGAGPVHPAVRRADRRAELDQRAGRVDGGRAAAGPPLLGPVVLDVVDRVQRLVAEHRGETLRAPPGGAVACVMVPYVRQVDAADEREQHAGPAVGRGVVEDRAGGAGVVDAEAVEPGRPPERRRVDGVALHQLAHVEAAQQLRAADRQPREPVDVEHHRRRCGDDDPLGPDHAAARCGRVT